MLYKMVTTAKTVTLTVDAKVFNIVAQLAHFSGGLAVVWGSTYFWNLRGGIIATGILAAVAAVKEWWYDNRYETPAERGSNLLDFVTYMAGAVVALGTVLLKLHLK